MNYARIQKRITKNQNTKVENYVYFGEVLKRIRKEKQMTQEAVTKGICSVSYYSKVENNKMIPPQYFIAEIGERLSVDLSAHFSGNVQESIVSRIVDAFFFDNMDALNSLKCSTDDLKHALINDIILLAESLLSAKYHEAKLLVATLEPLSNTMDQNAHQLFLVLSGILFYHVNKYHLAMQLLRVNEKQTEGLLKLKALEQHYLFLSKQQLGITVSSYENYHRALDLWKEFNHLKRLLELNLYRMYFLMQESMVFAEDAFSKFHPEYVFPELTNFYLYMQARLACYQNRHEYARESIKKLNPHYEDLWFYKALNIYYEISKSLPSFSEEDNGNYFENNKVLEIAILEKVRYTLGTITEEEEYREYIKDIALPLAIEHESLADITEYAMTLMRVASSSSRYKEALAVHTKMYRAIEKLQKIGG